MLPFRSISSNLYCSFHFVNFIVIFFHTTFNIFCIIIKYYYHIINYICNIILFNINFKLIISPFFIFWHGISIIDNSSDLFKEYLSKLLLETGSRGIRPVSFFYNYLPAFFITLFHTLNRFSLHIFSIS